MSGLGTIVNVLAIIVAGGVGVTFRGKLKIQYQKILLQAIGLGAILLGFLGAWRGIFPADGTRMEVDGTVLVLFALIIGAVFGEAFRLDRLVDRLGHQFRRMAEKSEAKEAQKSASKKGGKKNGGKTVGGKNAKGHPVTAAERRKAVRLAKEAATNGGHAPATASDGAAVQASTKRRFRLPNFAEMPTYDLTETRSGSLFVDGFSIATLICTFSGFAFSGALTDGLHDNPRALFTKAIVDVIFVFALTTVYGLGPTFAALPVLIVQGLVTLIAQFKGELLTATLMGHLSFIGSIMVIGAGINLCFGKRWRVLNLMPALLISPLYGIIMMLVEKFIDK